MTRAEVDSGDGTADAQPMWRSATHLISGTVVSQAVQFAASLVLARLFFPAEFGQFAAALGVATVLGVLFVLSYPSAIPLAATDEEARTLTWLSLSLALFLSVPVLAFLTLLAFADMSLVGMRVDYWFALFVPLCASVLAFFSTMQMKLSRHGEFRRIGLSAAVGALVQVGVQLSLGLAGSGATGLALGYLVGRLVNVTLLMGKGRLGPPAGRRAMAAASRSWSGRTRWLLVATVMNLASTAALAPWVHLHYDGGVAGSFAFALSTLSVPAALLGQAIGTILFPRMAAAERAKSLVADHLYAYVVGLSSVAFPLFLPIVILGSDLFTVVYGSEWRTAGLIATLVAPVLAVNFVSSPISSVALVHGKYKQTTLIATADAVLRLGAVTVGGLLGSVMVGFALYAVVGVTFYAGYIAWMLRLVGGSLLVVIRSHALSCVAAAVATGGLLVANEVAPFPVVVALTTIVCLVASWRALRRLLPRRRSEAR